MDRLRHLAINEEGFIFDPLTGNSFTTNRTGLFILSRLKEGKRDEEILEEMGEAFEGEKGEMEKDLTDFLEQLRFHGLVGE
jgi:PqqD family protein of HPr-rel-A system